MAVNGGHAGANKGPNWGHVTKWTETDPKRTTIKLTGVRRGGVVGIGVGVEGGCKGKRKSLSHGSDLRCGAATSSPPFGCCFPWSHKPLDSGEGSGGMKWGRGAKKGEIRGNLGSAVNDNGMIGLHEPLARFSHQCSFAIIKGR